jgi:hypothetical protein
LLVLGLLTWKVMVREWISMTNMIKIHRLETTECSLSLHAFDA